ncbi:DgyrCDS1490 [Dimorphilus gyrociliatus]|uniref:DgyrCDS1490 n=1 Tax=Dimorphilus gyrociliatus TaxID=2664684 RepID=A0A7I8V7P1_9ANNE|nr:DgyrCDS1490 [Dimorphilus gyrociliatus]
MNNFTSKVTSLSIKGWKDFSSVFTEQKTTLASVDSGPSEGSSLLEGKKKVQNKFSSNKNNKNEDPGQVQPLLDSSPDKEWEDRPTWNGLEREFKADLGVDNNIEHESRAKDPLEEQLKDDKKPKHRDAMNLIDFTQ